MPVGWINVPGRVAVVKPLHLVEVEYVALAVGDVRRRVEIDVADRVHQRLECECGTTRVASEQRAHGREIATGAVAADRDARGVSADLRRVRGGPLQRCEAVV